MLSNNSLPVLIYFDSNTQKKIRTGLQSMVLHHKMPAFELTKASAKFEVATSNRLRGDAFTRKKIISLLTLTLGHGQTGNFAQYPLHHITYAPAKFELLFPSV